MPPSSPQPRDYSWMSLVPLKYLALYIKSSMVLAINWQVKVIEARDMKSEFYSDNIHHFITELSARHTWLSNKNDRNSIQECDLIEKLINVIHGTENNFGYTHTMKLFGCVPKRLDTFLFSYTIYTSHNSVLLKYYADLKQPAPPLVVYRKYFPKMDFHFQNLRRFNQQYQSAYAHIQALIALEDASHINKNEVEYFEEIGKGTFGKVWEARIHGEAVAIKQLEYRCDGVGDGLEQLEEIRNEATLFAKCNDPHIITYRGFFKIDQKSFGIVQELFSTDLFHFLEHCHNHEGVLPSQDAKNIALAVAKGIHYLHTLTPPIIHRDIGTPNTLLKSDYSAKICDFGAACKLTDEDGDIKERTRFATRCAYAPPEMYAMLDLNTQAIPYDEKVDIYALGILLLNLIGDNPHRDTNENKVYHSRYEKKKPPKIPEHIEEALLSLVNHLTAYNPKDRPSAEVVVTELEEMEPDTFQFASRFGPQS